MADNPNISFIPKKSLARGMRGTSSPINVFFLIALLIVILSLVAYGGFYFYISSLEDKRELLEGKIEQIDNEVDYKTVDEAKTTQEKIEIAKKLLSNHTLTTVLLDVLSKTTLTSVVFSSFQYNNESDGTATVSLKGIATGFGPASLQRDAFVEENKYFSKIEFSGISLTNDGSVIFDVRAIVKKDAFSYLAVGNYDAISTQVTTSSTTTTATTTTSTATSSPTQ